MTYYWEGNNKTILLAHGWESNSFRWKNLITELQRYGYSIVALDAPAHGDSGSKMFNAILYSEFINMLLKDLIRMLLWDIPLVEWLPYFPNINILILR